MAFFIVTAVKTSNLTYKDSVRTSQETHYTSAIKPNRLMLFGERVAYCDNSSILPNYFMCIFIHFLVLTNLYLQPIHLCTSPDDDCLRSKHAVYVTLREKPQNIPLKTRDIFGRSMTVKTCLFANMAGLQG
jgi:hypothetical protein